MKPDDSYEAAIWTKTTENSEESPEWTGFAAGRRYETTIGTKTTEEEPDLLIYSRSGHACTHGRFRIRCRDRRSRGHHLHNSRRDGFRDASAWTSRSSPETDDQEQVEDAETHPVAMTVSVAVMRLAVALLAAPLLLVTLAVLPVLPFEVFTGFFRLGALASRLLLFLLAAVFLLLLGRFAQAGAAADRAFLLLLFVFLIFFFHILVSLLFR
ncbi:hypothetical protein L596_029277 [Steinernema carpocapsae]|uniref:Uncharacterized protein n=1 Tax=Steinernema carpocapsae TaxID=34508 RepID=A0A4U5LU67_STECR|nr:hypothetical protein L596_029277 [Steinernema carpocapsae]